MEVEEAVDDVTAELLLPGGVELVGLEDGVGDRDVEFAVEVFRVGAVVEGDDIGGTLVLEELPVHLGHLGGSDEVDADLGGAAHGGQGGLGPAAEFRGEHAVVPLAVHDRDEVGRRHGWQVAIGVQPGGWVPRWRS